MASTKLCSLGAAGFQPWLARLHSQLVLHAGFVSPSTCARRVTPMVAFVMSKLARNLRGQPALRDMRMRGAPTQRRDSCGNASLTLAQGALLSLPCTAAQQMSSRHCAAWGLQVFQPMLVRLRLQRGPAQHLARPRLVQADVASASLAIWLAVCHDASLICVLS